VFRAHHDLMGRTVAIKVLPRAKSTSEAEAAFQREIRMLARLDHENLVRALDAGHDGKVYYLVTELIPGLDLRRQVLKHGKLDEARAASVISQAAQGLAYAHAHGLVHRDVKPANLLVTPEGAVKVLDLGLAGSEIEGESARLGRVVGTMDYIAPEQIRTPDAVGPLADVYSLGCTLYFALTGEVPFPGGERRDKAQRHLKEQPRSVRQLEPMVSDGLALVVEAMMRKQLDERLPSAQAVIERLRPWTPATPLAMPRRRKERATAGGGEGLRGPPPLPHGSSGGHDSGHPLSRSQSLSGSESQSTRGLWSACEETAGDGVMPPTVPVRSGRPWLGGHARRDLAGKVFAAARAAGLVVAGALAVSCVAGIGVGKAGGGAVVLGLIVFAVRLARHLLPNRAGRR
jgi:serine/threonine protein kinase